jgi:hypothetical protein
MRYALGIRRQGCEVAHAWKKEGINKKNVPHVWEKKGE